MSAASRADKLKDFALWSAAHIKGDEKGEAQIFLDHLFNAFGWPGGLLAAGARCEERIKNDDGGTSFADMVWKPVVLIEMKKRGVDLSRHYRQAFDYWTRLVPNRPRYAILCNFDEFWVYDFETQMDTPVDKVTVADLSERYGPLNFLFPGDNAPVFGNHHETVTRRAADKLADCFNSMLRRGVEKSLAQRFILQMLMALFAEDIGLLEKYLVIKLLDECKTPRDTYDFIGGLFEAMNTPPPGHTGGRYAGVQYFNGGLFTSPARVELQANERMLLKEAADFNWAQVRPEIFGTLFEHSLGAEQRHAFGAHFTNVADIMKIVGPTIVEPWRERIHAASTLKELRALLVRLQEFKVLDPACGSGNFLYTAYREIKRLEATIYNKMAENFPKTVDPNQRPLGFVSVRNFFGMDVNPFAIDLAKVTMMLAHKLAIDELHINERALPLDNLDSNFAVRDALVQADGSRSPWFKADVIIGNPPFLGAKRLKAEHSAEYVNRIRRAYPSVPGMADLCVYWIRRAEDELPPCTAKDPTAGRAGLVGTQNIRNNASRVGGLDYVVASGTIVEAVDNQPWSGEAAVHVSIVNWAKTKDAALVPKNKRLWSEAPAAAIPKKRKRKGEEKAPKRYDLQFKEVAFINSSLSDRTDVSGAVPLSCNATPQKVFQGVTPGYDGFVLKPDRAKTLLKADKGADALIRPYMIGRELNGKETRPKRFIIDAFGKDLGDLTAWPKTFEHLKGSVLPKVEEKLEQEKKKKSDMIDARAEHLGRWWTFWAQRTELRKWQASHSRIIAASRTQREPFIFHFVDTNIDLGDKLQLFAFDDDYSFGILQSYAHCTWYKAKGARLKNEVDYNYSSREVFLTFPWPQNPTKAAVLAVAEAAREVRQARQKALDAGTGMRALYSTLSLPGASALRTAHAKLDEAVRAAYGLSAKKDLLAQLLKLNGEVSAAIAGGKSVTAPGIPASYSARKELASTDFVG